MSQQSSAPCLDSFFNSVAVVCFTSQQHTTVSPEQTCSDINFVSFTSQQHATVSPEQTCSDINFACFTSQQHATVSPEQTCSDICTCSYTETEVADKTCYQTQSKYIDSRPTSPSTNPVMPETWQDATYFLSHWLDSMREKAQGKVRLSPRSGWNSSVASVLGSLSCVMQLHGFNHPLNLPVEWTFPLKSTWVLTPFSKTLSYESMKLVCAHMHSIAHTQKNLAFVS